MELIMYCGSLLKSEKTIVKLQTGRGEAIDRFLAAWEAKVIDEEPQSITIEIASNLTLRFLDRLYTRGTEWEVLSIE